MCCCWNGLQPCQPHAAGSRSKVLSRPRSLTEEFNLLRLRKSYQKWPKPIHPPSEWDIWNARNKKIVQQLANSLNKSMSEINELLYELTLQNFSRIINPRGRGWNNCRVPFSSAAICDRYLNIFDLDGNLREPENPKSLFDLLHLLQEILRLEDDYDVDLDERAAIRESICLSKPEAEQLDNMKMVTREYKYDKPDEPTSGGRRSIMNRASILSSTSSYSMNNVIQVENRAQAQKLSDAQLIDNKGRRRGQGSTQLNTLRTDQAKILREILKSMKQGDPDSILDALSGADLLQSKNRKLMKKLKATKEAQELSSFYAKAVTELPKTGKLGEFKSHKSPKSILTTTSNKQADKLHDVALQRSDHGREHREPRERRYFAEPLPVLFHMPYDAANRSTWLRREPDQLRMQEDGHVGTSHVSRYRRESVMANVKKMRMRYSVHSVNSVLMQGGSKEPLDTKPEYRRIFSSGSRRKGRTGSNRTHNV